MINIVEQGYLCLHCYEVIDLLYVCLVYHILVPIFIGILSASLPAHASIVIGTMFVCHIHLKSKSWSTIFWGSAVGFGLGLWSNFVTRQVKQRISSFIIVRRQNRWPLRRIWVNGNNGYICIKTIARVTLINGLAFLRYHSGILESYFNYLDFL